MGLLSLFHAFIPDCKQTHFYFSLLVCYQERLLLSLLPAHIARVMKAEIIQRLKGPNFGQMENTNNFHNLYVQRHTNVRHVVFQHKVPFKLCSFNGCTSFVKVECIFVFVSPAFCTLTL